MWISAVKNDFVKKVWLIWWYLKAAGRDDASVETIAGSLIAISTSLFMSINLGSIATDTTSYVILGIAFLLNVIDVYGVAKSVKGLDFYEYMTTCLTLFEGGLKIYN